MSKHEIFEKMAKLEVETRKQVNQLYRVEAKDMAGRVTHEIFAIHNVIDALGFDLQEYYDYYTANRKRLRQEYNQVH